MSKYCVRADLKQAVLEIDKVCFAGDIPVITLRGELDVYTCPGLKERLIELHDEGKYHIVIDMVGVSGIDSNGMGVLIGAIKRATRTCDGSINIVPSQEVRHKLEMTRLDKVFGLYSDVSTALAAVSTTSRA